VEIKEKIAGARTRIKARAGARRRKNSRGRNREEERDARITSYIFGKERLVLLLLLLLRNLRNINFSDTDKRKSHTKKKVKQFKNLCDLKRTRGQPKET
jgi:hypothetical protein